MKEIAEFAKAAATKISREDAPPRAAEIDKPIARLTQLIAGKEVNEKGRLVAYYLRAEVRKLHNFARFKAKQPYDVKKAKAVLADYDKVIASGQDVPGWYTVANVEYLAGLVARNHLKSSALGYSYWQKCADRGHAGCMNTVATAKLTGAGGVRVDLRESLDLNEKVYNTGTGYRCAGANSAQAIALISHLTGTKRPGDDPLVWYERAYKLLDKLDGELKTRNPCDRAEFEALEYLLRFSGGEQRKELLERADARSEDGPMKSAIRYLSGSLDETAFRDVVSKANDYDRCSVSFVAFWDAQIKKNASTAKHHMDTMLGIGPEFCGTELAYAKGLRF